MHPQHPPRLKQNSKIALIAPGFTFKRELFDQGRSFLETKFGLKTEILENAFSQHHYLAGTDERRLEETYHWLTHPEIDGIFMIRGGFGCTRIYSELIKKLKAHPSLKPKVVLGYSDMTIFLNGFYQDLHWITFHGPAVVGKALREPLSLEEETFRKTLFSTEPLGKILDPSMITLFPGEARGKLIGGCLSLLVASIGTSYEIDTKDKILFIEDVTEKPYRLDRMLTQLYHAGKFNHIRGIIFGQMHDCGEPQEVLDAVQMAIEPIAKARHIPIIYHFPAGHGTPQITFPIGVEVHLKADTPTPEVYFLEAGVCA